MASNSDPEWASGWPAHGVLDLPECHIALDDAAWITWPGTGLQGRELSLADASGGRLSGQHVRATGTPAGHGDWHCYDLDFEFVYILHGTLTLENLEGSVHVLRPGSSFYHPAFFWHRDVHRSGDLQVVRLASPAREERFDGLSAPLPSRSQSLRPGRAGVYTHAAMKDEPGGRTLHERPITRDLGTRGPTDGRIGMRIVHGGRRWRGAGLRIAATDRWLYVVSGAAGLSPDRGLPVPLTPGDTLTTAAHGGNWRFHDITEDFIVLEMRTGLA